MTNQIGRLLNTTAVVTGASRGIGKAIAIKLAREGAWVALNCTSNVEKAEAVLSEIEALKKSGEAPESAGGAVYQFSVADSKAVGEAFAQILESRGKVDILVNNAGIARDALLLRAKEEAWDAVIDTNLKGCYLCMKSVAKPMMRARAGSIINISSVVGEMGNPGQSSYSASKAGILGLTKSVAKELASRGVRVNAITPGFIATEMTDAIPESARKEMTDHVPLQKLGDPNDIADAVIWLASNESSYVTGQVIGVNGGLYM